jgi:hypothetical protein
MLMTLNHFEGKNDTITHNMIRIVISDTYYEKDLRFQSKIPTFGATGNDTGIINQSETLNLNLSGKPNQSKLFERTSITQRSIKFIH